MGVVNQEPWKPAQLCPHNVLSCNRFQKEEGEGVLMMALVVHTPPGNPSPGEMQCFYHRSSHGSLRRNQWVWVFSLQLLGWMVSCIVDSAAWAPSCNHHWLLLPSLWLWDQPWRGLKIGPTHWYFSERDGILNPAFLSFLDPFWIAGHQCSILCKKKKKKN